jgi:hypothetical protein
MLPQPKKSAPVYTTKIPSSGETIKFHPFLVEDEKALLIAQESEDLDVMIDTILDVISRCVLSTIDTDKLAIFDIEFIFLQIRAKSVGETAELIFSCDDCVTPTSKVKISFNLENINVEKNPKHTKRIPLFDDVGVMMKYPAYKSLKLLDSNLKDTEMEFDLVIDSVDYIFDKEEIHHVSDYSREEIVQFFNELTKENFNKVYEFFETMPQMVQRVKYKCPDCGKAHNKIIEGIEYFF